MTQVFFCKLEREEKALHLCRISEQHYNRRERCLIHVSDPNRAATLDRFMWGWNRGSFLPHACDSGSVECFDEPIVISSREHNYNRARVLIMGSPCQLDFVRRFEFVYDFAEEYDQTLLSAARERFKLYRAHGFNPQLCN